MAEKKKGAKKPGTGKASAKKTGTKKTGAKKTAEKKTAAKKSTAKKTAAKKTAAKKEPAKKTPKKKPAPRQKAAQIPSGDGSGRLRITQTRSPIGRPQNQKRTLQALGLHRIRQSVEHQDTPNIRGMVARVIHLVRVEEIR